MKAVLTVGGNSLTLEGSPVKLEIDGDVVFEGADKPPAPPPLPAIDYTNPRFNIQGISDDEQRLHILTWVYPNGLPANWDPRAYEAATGRVWGRFETPSGPAPVKTGTNLDLGRRENQHKANTPIPYTFTVTKPSSVTLTFAPLSGQYYGVFAQWLKGPGVNEPTPVRPDSTIDDKFTRSILLQPGVYTWTVVLSSDCFLGVAKGS